MRKSRLKQTNSDIPWDFSFFFINFVALMTLGQLFSKSRFINFNLKAMAALDFNTIVGHNPKTFDMICELFEEYDKQRILYALYDNELTKADMEIMLSEIKASRLLMKKEYISLSCFSTNFPWEFATANNQCFDTLSSLLNRTRSTSKASRVLYDKFRPKLRKKAYDKDGQQIQPKSCYLLKGTDYEKDFYENDYYAPIVDELCSEIELLYVDILAVSVLCRETLNTERSIKMDKDKCMEVYNKSLEKIKKNIDWNNGTITIELKSTSADEIAKIREHAKSLKEFAYQEYHKHTDKEFKQYVIKMTFIRGKDNGLEGLERTLWEKNPQKGKQVRFIIGHLEEIVDKLQVFTTKGTHKMPGGFIAWLMEWSEKDGKDTDFFRYLRDTYKGTKYPLPQNNSAFSNQKSRNARNPESDVVWHVKKDDFLSAVNSYFNTDSMGEQQKTTM